MIVNAIRTDPVNMGDSLEQILIRFLPPLAEKSIVVVTSKIVSLCENRVVPNTGVIDKNELIRQESEFYLERSNDAFNVMLTIKNDTLIAGAGIDESNGNGNFILWPKNPEQSAKKMRNFLKQHYNIQDLGVIITDSRLIPMRWGTMGISLAGAGFAPLTNYIGKPDIFGHKLRMTKSSIIDGLSAAAVVAMGEGNEQTPLAIISEVPFVHFTEMKTESVTISKEEDIYSPLTDSPKWQKGGH